MTTVPKGQRRSLASRRFGQCAGFLIGLAAWCGPDAGDGPCEALDLDEAREVAELVVRVRVVGIGNINGTTYATFRTEASWKGPVARFGLARGDAIDWKFGDSYLLFADDLITCGRGGCEECENNRLDLEVLACSPSGTFDPEVARALGEPRWSVPSSTFLRGDVDLDQRITVSDSVILLNRLFAGWANADCEDASDVNDDGALDLSDAIYGLRHLFLGGPEPPAPGTSTYGFDTTADPWTCGDEDEIPLGVVSQSNLPGVRLEIVRSPKAVTVEEAEAGVSFTYRLVVERPVSFVRPARAACLDRELGALFVRRRVFGAGLEYCSSCEEFCERPPASTLEAGSVSRVFRWCGRVPPSQFLGPFDVFPPGVHTFEVRANGTWRDAEGGLREFELISRVDFELTP